MYTVGLVVGAANEAETVLDMSARDGIKLGKFVTSALGNAVGASEGALCGAVDGVVEG